MSSSENCWFSENGLASALNPALSAAGGLPDLSPDPPDPPSLATFPPLNSASSLTKSQKRRSTTPLVDSSSTMETTTPVVAADSTPDVVMVDSTPSPPKTISDLVFGTVADLEFGCYYGLANGA
ncbi:hypothetical protein Bca52824_021787 [Brassica carinata]|uniref:Uncharacterized protein n=1 Tax=Brassica carinata TaxID=52824 RepID=A0A8X7VFU5_BRACI|nr:hypothetical protein Bca52824_021787 [Brassica carinata]